MINIKTLNDALSVIVKHNNPSISLLRVHLNLTLSEASQIINTFEQNNIIKKDQNGEYIIVHSNVIFKNNTNIQTTDEPMTLSGNFCFDSLDGHSFEYFCADLLYYNGYTNIQVTSGSGDFGVDILCNLNTETYAIQCKCYSGNVGNKAVQEVVTGRIFYNCTKSVVMTNSYFTAAAEETARLTNTELWDRHRINEMLSIALRNGYSIKK